MNDDSAIVGWLVLCAAYPKQNVTMLSISRENTPYPPNAPGGWGFVLLKKHVRVANISLAQAQISSLRGLIFICSEEKKRGGL